MTRSHYSVTFRSIETGNIEVSRFFSTVAAARKWAAFLSAKFSEVAIYRGHPGEERIA